uniref:PDZ domain-containing protein n=1 Tax=Odontella aurita TaxID=265563 RepID=A0A7S4IT66_9STRA|mmetsp:Transcript_29928/g.88989  ORF Transcript_29928/g.88989 Transcript_29928/m.88989 type:complete len:203 (+) Transcript_29928:159-767(+)|eukprot:CAMPEP_0113541898 /NCGR_PEP_ID=MMETSP0015_2-20120614/9301_1 /TAXON_ID=2838 /ORGANISM="Odontella" /LENGTH=202 /DNA_ID=CAMNT_0000441883 /DNA_START=131 /DNA_END=739 /DNA_ORIENTATION=- /assembly_acc=CAM_ASM_000160
MRSTTLLAPLALAASSMAFVPTSIGGATVLSQCPVAAADSTVALSMASENDLRRWEKASRAAGAEDRVVELRRPLGLVLNDDGNGNVYVETVAPRGNAARTGEVKEGDLVTMCSATFGDQMWSCRGAGLTRVLAAIRVRAGPTVKLVFESTAESKTKVKRGAKAVKAAEEARANAQAKRDQLLDELEQDEKKLKKGKFLGLF